MQRLNSFVFKVISLLLSPRFGACTAGVRPFPLAMQHFFSFVSQVISVFPQQVVVTVGGSKCFPRVSALLPDSVSAFRPACLSLFPFLLVTVSTLSLFILSSSPVLSPFLWVIVSVLSPFCFLLFPFFLIIVSVLFPSCPSCLPSVSLLSPFLLVIVSALSSSFLYMCLLSPPLACNPSHVSPSCSALQSFTFVSQLWAACRLQSFTFASLCPHLWAAVSASAQSFTFVPAPGCCARLCLPILNFTLVSLFAECSDFEKHKLFGAYGGVIPMSWLGLGWASCVFQLRSSAV